MKKIILILLLTIGVVPVILGQLNENATLLKSLDDPSTYNQIKQYAVNKWVDDHKMVLYTINKESDALIEVLDLRSREDFDEDILVKAALKWEDEKTGYHINSMILYEYKKQLKAKSQY